MSTKIYTAWRCRVPVFTQVFLPEFRRHAFAEITKRFRQLMSKTEVTDSCRAALSAKYVRMGSRLPTSREVDQRIRFDKVMELIKEASVSLVRDPVACLDVSLNVWIYRHRTYVVPCGEAWIWDSFEIPDRVEDYSYWNNIDEPHDGVTYSAWRRRGEVWNAVCLDRDWDEGRLNHVVFEATRPRDTYKLSQAVLAKRKVKE